MAKHSNTSHTVAEIGPLKLHRPDSDNEYLYSQIFAGLSCVVVSLCLLELWRVKNRRNLLMRVKRERLGDGNTWKLVDGNVQKIVYRRTCNYFE
jgi:hypothetical protein